LACYAAIDQAGRDRILSLTALHEEQWLSAMHLDTPRHAAESLLVSAMFSDHTDLARSLNAQVPFANAVRRDCFDEARPWLSAHAPDAELWTNAVPSRVLGRSSRVQRAVHHVPHHRPVKTWAGRYSHSIVPGGLDVMSSVTRLTCAISLIMREATFSSRSYGRRAQSAVIASSLVTALITTTYP
jgi:hypothetical protein